MPIHTKFEGINGSVATGPYRGWFELLDVRFGRENYSVGTGMFPHAPNEVVLIKVQDSSSVQLWTAASSKKRSKVTIEFTHDDGTRYAQIVMEESVIDYFNFTAGTDEKRMTERFVLDFTKITSRYVAAAAKT
jgi:type VI protein secretion system component Hcp